jgi:hypothetical protein
MRSRLILAIAAISAIRITFPRTLRYAPLRAVGTAVVKLLNARFGAIALLPVAVLLLAAWSDPPVPLLHKSNPADPRAPVPRVGYRSTIAPYKSRRPVEPTPWSEQNRRIAPQPKSSP